MVLYKDSEFHKGSLVGRMSQYANRTASRVKQQLGVPYMRTVTFVGEAEPTSIVTKVTQVGIQTLKAYQDTGVSIKLEDLIISEVPRSIPIETVQFSMVILGTSPATERAKVIWVDERDILSYQVIVRLLQQR